MNHFQEIIENDNVVGFLVRFGPNQNFTKISSYIPLKPSLPPNFMQKIWKK